MSYYRANPLLVLVQTSFMDGPELIRLKKCSLRTLAPANHMYVTSNSHVVSGSTSSLFRGHKSA